jgi:hypothetical protein
MPPLSLPLSPQHVASSSLAAGVQVCRAMNVVHGCRREQGGAARIDHLVKGKCALGPFLSILVIKC